MISGANAVNPPGEPDAPWAACAVATNIVNPPYLIVSKDAIFSWFDPGVRSPDRHPTDSSQHPLVARRKPSKFPSTMACRALETSWV